MIETRVAREKIIVLPEPMHCQSIDSVCSRKCGGALVSRSYLNAVKAGSVQTLAFLGQRKADHRMQLGHVQHIQHTTGIHFDRRSLRWKATWYDNTGQRKAKYFPVGEHSSTR